MKEWEKQSMGSGMTEMLEMLGEAHKLGFDRYSLEGHTQGSVCRLWREREQKASIKVHSYSPESALSQAVQLARVYVEQNLEGLQTSTVSGSSRSTESSPK